MTEPLILLEVALKAKKSFGQNWLKDPYVLDRIVKSAEIIPNDTILEVGPGLGTLTEKLLQTKANVIAVEADKDLLPNLVNLFKDRPNFKLINEDILKLNLSLINPGYKVVANIPYYLTSNLIRILLEDHNPPQSMVLLIQKEVAQRILAKPGHMSVLSFSVQYYAKPEFVMDVKRELFEPIPKVDSAVIRISRLSNPLFEANTKKLFRLVKAGFGEKRKMLRNSLAGGLGIEPSEIDKILKKSVIPSSARAQELSMHNWHELYRKFIDLKII